MFKGRFQCAVAGFYIIFKFYLTEYLSFVCGRTDDSI